MPSYTSDRRSLLKIFGAIGATCAYPFASDELFAQTAPMQHPHPAQAIDATTRFFHDDDFALISKVADLIIPETDTPGAVGRRCARLHRSRHLPQYGPAIRSWRTACAGLMKKPMRLAQKKFVDLDESQQLSILQPLCDAFDADNLKARNVQFFALMKSLTADGYYTSKIGLLQELGYTGDTAMAAFPDCVHEH